MSTTRSTSCSDRELLGLNGPNNGRSCEQHECCGKALKTDDVLRFRLAVVEAIGDHQGCHHQVWHRTLLCWVSGQGSSALALQRIKYIDKFAQVLELYDTHKIQ